MAQTDVMRLKNVLRSVSEALEAVRSCNCEGAVFLLEMAELELRMKANKVSDEELRVFCRVLERRMQCKPDTNVVEMRPRIAKNGHRRRS